MGFTTTTFMKGTRRWLDINAVHLDADPKTRELLGAVEKKMGMVPNMIATMAQIPAVIKAYLGFSQAMAGASLSAALQQQISLAVSEPISATTAYRLTASWEARLASVIPIFSMPGMERLRCGDRCRSAFARKIVENRGHVSDEDVEEVRRAGYTDGEITEIVANVALTSSLTISITSQTQTDFPLAPMLATV